MSVPAAERTVGAASRIATTVGALGLTLVGVVSFVLSIYSGGFFVADWGIAAAVVLAGAAVVGLLAGGSGGLAGAAMVGSWFGLFAYQSVSAMWALDPGASQQVANLTLLYTGTLVIALAGVRRATWLPRVSDAVLAGLAIVAALALTARLVPGSIGDDPQGRLSWPIGYWNGLGAMLATGLVLAIGVGASPGRPLWLRGVAAALVPMFTVGLLLTLSRGAILVAIVALVGLLLIGPRRLETLVLAAVTLALALPLAAYANSQDNLVSLSGAPLPEHAAAGARLGVLLLLGMLGAGLLGALASFGITYVRGKTRERVLMAVGATAAIGLLALVLIPPPPNGVVATADDQFERFRSYDGSRGETASLADRLADAAGSGRWQQWEVATEEWGSAPIVGTGAGDYVYWWNEERPFDQAVVNAHSLYLETLGESGVLGFLLLVAPLGIGAVLLVRTRARMAGDAWLAREHAVAAAGVSVVVLHAAGDWDWQLPAVIIPAILLGGAATKAAILAGRSVPSRGAWVDSIATRAAVAAVALVCVPIVLGPALSARDASEARALARSGEFSAAIDEAREAVARDRSSSDARLLEANLLSDLGRFGAANASYREALQRAPRSWLVMTDWAASLVTQGRPAAARSLANRAASVNPLEPRVLALNESLASD